MTQTRLLLLIAVLLIAATGCKKSEPEAPVAAKPAALQAPAPAAPAPEPAKPPQQEVPADWPDMSKIPKHKGVLGMKEGYSQFELRDSLPICLFSSYEERDKAKILDRVTKQTFKPGGMVLVGVFPRGCLNQECDDRPTLQCWVDKEGEDTWVVSTRFASFRKDEGTCTKDCMETDASCEIAEVKAGKYKIRHGDKTYDFKMPSTLGNPCLNAP